MPVWSNRAAAPQQVSLVLFDGFSNHCLANTLEPLRAANMLALRSLYHWQIVTADGAPARSSSGLAVAADLALGQAAGDFLIVMPSYDYLAHDRPALRLALRRASARFTTLGGFDTGAWLLASSGLLDGRRATIHRAELAAFAEAFPRLEAVAEHAVTDGDRITCGGALAAFDLITRMIGERHGQALRLEIAALFIRESTAAAVAEGVPVRKPSVARALRLMESHVEEPLSVAEIARQAGRRSRDLARRMKAELGATPRAVYRRIRLAEARRLTCETELPVAEIALRCGYTDASAMTRAFRSEFGLSPRKLRTRTGAQTERCRDQLA